MRLTHRLPVVLLTLVLALALAQVALPDAAMRRLALTTHAATTLTFSPTTTTVAVGGEAWVAINVADVTDLAGVELRVTFNPNLIEVTAVEQGVYPRPDFVQSAAADNVAGHVEYIVVQFNDGSSGSGLVARFRVRGKALGTAPLAFAVHMLLDTSAAEISHSVGSGSVQVTAGGASATPTITLTPSLTPSPSSTPISSATPYPTSTTTPTSSVTPTYPPYFTPLPSLTPSVTPTAVQRTFSGTVYQGGCGDTKHPLGGVRVHLMGSNEAGHPGVYLTFAESGPSGQFSITYLGNWRHYSLVEIEEPGFASSCVDPGAGGIVPDSSGNWVEFRNVSAASYSGTRFFDYQTGNLTPSAVPTQGTPEPTPGGPIYVNKRGAGVTEDTFLNQREQLQNYGGVGYLHLGKGQEGIIKTALVRFDLSDIPSGAVIAEARFSLYGQDLDGTIALDVSMLLRHWAEMQATWRVTQLEDPWGAPGALGDEDHTFPPVRGTFRPGTQAQAYEWEVRDLVQAWVSGAAQNHGFLVLPAPGAKAKETLGLFSSEYALPLLRPLLTVLYTVPTPTPTATPTSTATPTETPTATPMSGLWLPLIHKYGA